MRGHGFKNNTSVIVAVKVWLKIQVFDWKTIFLVRSSECTATHTSEHALVSMFQSNSHNFATGRPQCLTASVIPSLGSSFQSFWNQAVSSHTHITHLSHQITIFQDHDQNCDHFQRASYCISGRDEKGAFRTLLAAPTRTHICWSQQSGKHSPPQRWAWHFRLLHDMQAQHFIRRRDFSWASSADASHFQELYVRKCVQVSRLLMAPIRSSGHKGTSEK